VIRLAAYHVLTTTPAPPTPKGCLYTYVFAGNGVFITASQPGLDALARVGPCDVRGLPPADAYANFNLPRVPERITRACFNRARSVCVGTARPREVLFYLIFEAGVWRMVEPEQVADAGGVRPVDPLNEDCARAVIELHSHHEMAAFWSGQDDEDESGFKLYAVIGRIFSAPTLRVRAGVYGHFVEVPARDVFELPADVYGAALRDGKSGEGAGGEAGESDEDAEPIICGDCFGMASDADLVREQGGAYCPGCGARLCRKCGCTELAACAEGCSWSSDPEVCDSHEGEV
jgi:PRTRC genetic system protein A